MFSGLFLSILAYICLSQVPDPTSTIYFTQEIDWFNPQDNRTYQEQVLIYDKYYNKENGVIFFYKFTWFYKYKQLFLHFA